MKQYFCTVDIKDDNAKVNIIAQYFIDFVLLWWRHRSTNEKRSQAASEIWKEFQNEFKEFSELMLQITNLSEGTFFFFIDVLKPWFNNNNGGHSDNEKPQNGKRKPDKPWEKKGSLKCSICEGSHMVKDCSKRSLFSAIKEDDEPKKAPMRLGSIVRGVEAKRATKEIEAEPIDGKVLELGSLILKSAKAKRDRKPSNLFISKKIVGKLDFSVSESTKKIKTVNSKEVPSVGIVQEINVLLVPFADCMCILDIQQQCVVLKSRDMRGGTKDKIMMQTGQMKRVNATSEVHHKYFDSVLHFNLSLVWQRHRCIFRVLKRVGQDAYKPELIVRLKVNPMFKVVVPKPICAD
ncbi:hypothetical protein Goshw_016456 [Gossypium schwendimanii]|uniref:Uncharacterized protein n=1 Tax=Gossypium schwendimanii TaxID=34291 RepID=A0A7J9N5T1_GOSSC|nr:hypothetical protein [Gossypium schwendimanii]